MIISELKKYILVDGFHIVADLKRSQGSWIVDVETDKKYLDCYSQFASQALGWNHASYLANAERIREVSLCKLANSDMYSKPYLDFVKEFASITSDFKHYFFIEGGANGVENALKAAFDWKAQQEFKHQFTDGDDLDVVHLEKAFHGRSGYTLSLTNTGELKTRWFPKFPWTRIRNLEDKEGALLQIKKVFQSGNVAAFIAEPIQAEGGDNHFDNDFFVQARKLCDEYGVMMILDEVQTGMGLTGSWWAYQHTGVIPDMVCFGKKVQTCGFCATSRIDSVEENVFCKSGRINSTWGGNLVDMVRATVVIEIIKAESLVENSKVVGEYFLSELKRNKLGENIRGKGLMLAFDIPDRDKVLENLHDNGLLALKCGEKSIRFRPVLTFSKGDVDSAINILKSVI